MAVTLKSNQRPAPPGGASSSPIDWDAALTTVAKAVPRQGGPLPEFGTKKNRTSRFFFRVTEDLVAQQREATKPKEVDHVDKAVSQHAKSAEGTFPSLLAANIDEVRQFFVDELSPLTLSLGTGADQAREVIKRVIGTEVSPEAFYRFEQMAHQAVLIRLSVFLEKFLGLPEGSANDLLPKPSQRVASPPSPTPQPDEPSGSRRELKGLHRTLQNLLDHQTTGAKNNGSSKPSEPSRQSAPTITPISG